MRIAQVAPLFESVPPNLYGGTERVVFHLTEELVRLGHDVTLFASGDSRVSASLVAACPRALRLDGECRDHLAYHIMMLDRLYEEAHRFDLIHFHISHIHFPLARRLGPSSVTTLHGRLDCPELAELYARFSAEPLVSISYAQRRPLSDVNWGGNVYHGYPRTSLAFSPGPGGYLAFLGRISPEKRVDRAIEIARRAGMRLRIAAKVDPADEVYFEREIKHLLSDPLVEFIGEIGDEEKNAFLGGAAALLFPIDWPEPFGLVMIESLGCGTPVVAFNHGSVPEILDHGRTGFVVESIEEAVESVRRLSSIKRAECRKEFVDRFSVERMTENYVGIYETIIRAERERGRRRYERPGDKVTRFRRSYLYPGELPPGRAQGQGSKA
jgi:glycosyltransferase involved in cell wall biosynthesis